MAEEGLVSNGINGATGGYLLPELTTRQLSRIVQGEDLDPGELAELRHRTRSAEAVCLGVREGVDPGKLGEAGWGVVFAHDDRDEVDAWREALRPLLELRREQAGERYREYTADGALRPGESKNRWLARHGVGPGPADPDRVPYYLLIVADPDSVPYRFQYQLAVQYAVGRIHFDTGAELSRYAQSVVEAESGDVVRPRRAVFFGVENPGDAATRLSAGQLVRPLAEHLRQAQPDWTIEARLAEQATKDELRRLLGAEDGPALVFTASHGMGFPGDDPRQLAHQGRCSARTGPDPSAGARDPYTSTHYFSADDLGVDARVGGLVGFHFACYGAGTPRYDEFAHTAFGERREIAPRPFVARLPSRLLSHEKGGALAVVGHVDRAWGCSFLWDRAGAQRTVFESTLERLMQGYPLGSALEYFSERYAELSTLLSEELEEVKYGKEPDDLELAGLWTANNDARSFVIVGDPAVRLAVR